MIQEVLSNPLDTAATLALGSATVVWLGRVIWRRISKDGTEVAKDRAEINIIDTMLAQMATLSQENQRLRTSESDLSIRLGRLEAKEKEVESLMERIDHLQKKLDEKDIKIEKMIILHAEENTKMMILLGIKDNEIKELKDRVNELESNLRTK